MTPKAWCGTPANEGVGIVQINFSQPHVTKENVFHFRAQAPLANKMKHVLIETRRLSGAHLRAFCRGVHNARGESMGENPHLIVQREGHVVTVIMNRPEARNAFGAEMLVRLADAWDLIDGDDGVRVAILTGAGGHFCAGSDLEGDGRRVEGGRVVGALQDRP